MDATIARLNIEHIRRLLAHETDQGRREILRGKLAEEKAKLAAMAAKEAACYPREPRLPLEKRP